MPNNYVREPLQTPQGAGRNLFPGSKWLELKGFRCSVWQGGIYNIWTAQVCINIVSTNAYISEVKTTRLLHSCCKFKVPKQRLQAGFVSHGLDVPSERWVATCALGHFGRAVSPLMNSWSWWTWTLSQKSFGRSTKPRMNHSNDWKNVFPPWKPGVKPRNMLRFPRCPHLESLSCLWEFGWSLTSNSTSFVLIGPCPISDLWTLQLIFESRIFPFLQGFELFSCIQRCRHSSHVP